MSPRFRLLLAAAFLCALPFGRARAQVIDFGSVVVGQSRDSSALLTNPTPVPYSVTTTKFKKSPSDFSITAGGAPFTIPGNGSHLVSMRFTPAAVGLRTDSLYVYGTFPGSPIIVPLQGTGVPLPVELALFTAEWSGAQALLRWTTASETHNFGFEVQRRVIGPAGGDFRTIGFVRGAGDSWEPVRYAYPDASSAEIPRGADLEYRLRQIDFDGTATLSPVARLQSADARPPERVEAELYPNPCAGALTVRLRIPAGDEIAGISVVDPAGRIRRVPLPAEPGDDAADRTAICVLGARVLAAPGIYLLRVESRGGVIAQRFLNLR